ncbi:alpha/beta hydrolase [Arthrobacter sp. FW306-05-C]|uniref:alpha/beta hydrolase family protein n=1 Tax=Arthrobacter sp. FW306-05-C TaxID=2879620 RepID=UPI001F3D2EAD|nr:alpha/beta fold hydrolase [Arthrobacter sp. FW306-05-C]UKA68350.1 alpha/beta hydrolase [Arthrobacter sp. FW306-05-C]
MKAPKVLGPLALAAVCASSISFLGAAYFARRVVVPSTTRREDLCIRQVFSGEDGSLRIELPATPLTRAPGRYSLWFGNGKGHACIGPVVDEETNKETVIRLVERVDSGDLRSATAGIWSGYAYSEPGQLSLPFEEVEIQVDGGTAPAWKFAPRVAGPVSSLWAIHAHGLGGKRSGALRGVPVASRLGITSLVVSFRNDGEAPPSNDSRYSLGQNEWLDVEGAIRYAVDHGAVRLVLFGWSLGGSMALRAANLSAHADRIIGLVLVAPVLDWAETLTSNGSASGLPEAIARAGLRLLSSNAGRWVTGLNQSIDLSALDWVSRAGDLNTPTLILHGINDKSTPVAVSERFAELRPDLVQLVRFDVPGHSLEWNADTEKWESSVTGFLKSLPTD